MNNTVENNYDTIYEIVGRLVGLNKFSYEHYKSLKEKADKSKDSETLEKLANFENKLAELIENPDLDTQFKINFNKLNYSLGEDDKIVDNETFFKLGKKIDELKERAKRAVRYEDGDELADLEEEEKKEEEKKDAVEKSDKIAKSEASSEKEIKEPNKFVTKIFDGIQKVADTKFAKNTKKFFDKKWVKKVGKVLRVPIVGAAYITGVVLAAAGVGALIAGPGAIAAVPGALIAIPAVVGGYYAVKGISKLVKKAYDKNRIQKAKYEDSQDLFNIKEEDKVEEKAQNKENIFEEFDKDDLKTVTDNKEDKVFEDFDKKQEDGEDMKDIENEAVQTNEPVKKVITSDENSQDLSRKGVEFFEQQILENPALLYDKDYKKAYEKALIAKEMYETDYNNDFKTTSEKLKEYKQALIDYRVLEEQSKDNPMIKNIPGYHEKMHELTEKCSNLGKDPEVSEVMNYLNNKKAGIENPENNMKYVHRNGEIQKYESEMNDVLIGAHNRIKAQRDKEELMAKKRELETLRSNARLLNNEIKHQEQSLGQQGQNMGENSKSR